MRVEAGQVLIAVLVAAIVAVSASALFGQHGLQHVVKLHAERRELAQTTFTLLETTARLRREMQHLRDNELHLEGLARRQLGLVRPDEVVYRFQRPPG